MKTNIKHYKDFYIFNSKTFDITLATSTNLIKRIKGKYHYRSIDFSENFLDSDYDNNFIFAPWFVDRKNFYEQF